MGRVIESPDFVVRPSQPDDFVGIHDLLTSTDMYNAERDGPLLSFGQSDRLVAVLGSEVIGHVYAGDNNGLAVAESLIVSPEYRRQHVATALIEALRLHLVQQGRGNAELLVDADRDDLVEFYRALGYNSTCQCTIMERPLSRWRYGNTVRAFNKIYREKRTGYIHTYDSQSTAELQDMLANARSPLINSLRLDDGEHNLPLPLFMTPWCVSASQGNELVRWGEVPLVGGLSVMLREVRTPMADRPSANPFGERMGYHGNYLVLHEPNGQHPARVVAFRVTEEDSRAVQLTGARASSVLSDLKYAAREALPRRASAV